VAGYYYCDLLLWKADYDAARNRAGQSLEWVEWRKLPFEVALDTLTIGRTGLGLALQNAALSDAITHNYVHEVYVAFDNAVEGLRAAGQHHLLPRGLLARAAFRRSVGDWGGTARDLDDVLEVAEPGPMRLFLCDTALERARLAFAQLEAFAPLNGLVDDSPRKLDLPDAPEAARLREEATENLATARKLITECGYHRRDEELAELEDVATGRRRFADLPPRV
jgi:hypothetical protein